jgi:hypothetical protein
VISERNFSYASSKYDRYAHESTFQSAFLHLPPHERAILSRETASIHRLSQHEQLHVHLGIAIMLNDLLLLHMASQVLPHATLARRLAVPLPFSIPSQ